MTDKKMRFAEIEIDPTRRAEVLDSFRRMPGMTVTDDDRIEIAPWLTCGFIFLGKMPGGMRIARLVGWLVGVWQKITDWPKMAIGLSGGLTKNRR